MLYRTLKRCIERKNYDNKEEFAEKIAILFASGQLTKEQYEELIALLEA